MNTIFNQILDAARNEFVNYKIAFTIHENVVVSETRGYKNTVFNGCKSDFVDWLMNRTNDDNTIELCNQYDDDVNYNF